MKKKKKITRSRKPKIVPNHMLVEMVQYLLDDNIRMKKILTSHHKHEGKSFGGTSQFSRNQR
jgi:hypothetical protein